MSEDPSAIDRRDVSAIAGRVTAEVERQIRQPLAEGLYLVATPIGHLADMTVRAIATLANSDVIYCEDTRHSRTLLSHYAIHVPLRPYHEHNADEQRPRILEELSQGKAIALISDAGTPLVSDPGFKLVRDCCALGHRVTAIPGASATLTALTVAGLPTDAFFFAGFLPSKEGARRSRLAELATIPGTIIFFEAPTRTAATLMDIAAVLGNREAVVARELTKLHEEVRRGPPADLAASFESETVKGEIVILLGPPQPVEVDDTKIEDELSSVLKKLSLRDASRIVAETLNVPKARVYDIGLALKRRAEG